MRRTYLASGALLMAVLALSGIGTSTAAARCAMSTEDVGNYKNISASGDCIEHSIFRIQLLVIVDNFNEASLGGGVDCAEEAETGTGFSTNSCTGEQAEGSGKWIKVDAASWKVNGAALTGTAALAKTAEVTEAWKLTASGTNVECAGKALSATSEVIEAPNKGSVSSLIFSECKASEPCSIAGTEVKTVPLVSETEGGEGAEGAKFILKPKTKTILATIDFLGSTCALLGVQPVTGKATTLLPNGFLEKTLQEISTNIPSSSGELKVGSSAAELKFKALLKLETGKLWSFN
jgi:hypothetical protein